MWTCRAASRAEINSRYFTMSPSHRRSRVAWLALAVPACSASFVTPPALHECRTRTRTICMDASEAPLLDVVGLKASVVGTQILKGVTLKVNRGEVHAIMGPNGSGKSTFSKVLVGHPAYEVDGGTAQYRGEDILEDAPESRAQDGIFLAFQYPVEIPGVSNNDFLRMAVNKRRGAQDLEEYDPIEFMGVLAEKMDVVGMKMDFMSRDVNRCVLPPASRSTLRSLRRSPRDARRHRAAARVHACGVEIEMKSRFRSAVLCSIAHSWPACSPSCLAAASPAARRSVTRSCRWLCSSRSLRSSTRLTRASTLMRSRLSRKESTRAPTPHAHAHAACRRPRAPPRKPAARTFALGTR